MRGLPANSAENFRHRGLSGGAQSIRTLRRLRGFRSALKALQPDRDVRVARDWYGGRQLLDKQWHATGALDHHKASKTKREPTNLQRQLEQLKQLKPEELRKRWHALFGSNPPPRIRSSLMVQAIARRLQEKALGGLKPSTQRLLHRVAEEANGGRKVSATIKKIGPRPGTVLVREWHGRKHQVSVLKDGFLYRSKRYGSLSQIARTITGTQWSGPLFFGLKSRSEHGRGAA